MHDQKVVVLGSGFGGGILACRTAKKWPGKVMVIERGKRYPMGSFPRTPREMARNFWNPETEKTRTRPGKLNKLSETMNGLFDIRNFKHMDAVICAGYGGGSLIYANVFLEPPEHVFDQRWPKAINKLTLQPYYNVAKSVLGSRPIPKNDEPRRRIVRTELFEQFAQHEKRNSQLLDINVFFGNDFNNPTGIGIQEKNQFGATQTSCVYCAECDIGCNYHSKNTIDLNYLYVAEHKYKARIMTDHLAEYAVPLDEFGNDQPKEDGHFGYRVYYRDLQNQSEHSVTTQRVVVSCGTLGSTEFLMRCRDVYQSLQRVNNNLGKSFSGNGDFLSFVIDGKKPANPNYGPVITQRIDYNLFSDFDKEAAFVLEDASYPNLAAWYVEGVTSGASRLSQLGQVLKIFFLRLLKGKSNTQLGYAFNLLLKKDLSFTSAVLLCMGIDKSTGIMALDGNGHIDVDWPYKSNLPLYNKILGVGERFRDFCEGKIFIPLPNWIWPVRNNITVHCLGGCILGDTEEVGVTNSSPENMGQVYGYKGLYVADGAIVPTAVGANPTATICALSEKIAEGITGNKPSEQL